MRGIAHEGHLGGPRGVQAGEHRVHRAGQARDLVLRLGHRHPLAPPRGGDLGHPRPDRFHRPQHAAHRVVHEHRGRQSGHGHEGQEQDRARREHGVVPVGVRAHLDGERHAAQVHADRRHPQVRPAGDSSWCRVISPAAGAGTGGTSSSPRVTWAASSRSPGPTIRTRSTPDSGSATRSRAARGPRADRAPPRRPPDPGPPCRSRCARRCAAAATRPPPRRPAPG